MAKQFLEVREAIAVHRVDVHEIGHQKVHQAPPLGNAPVLLPLAQYIFLGGLALGQPLEHHLAHRFALAQGIHKLLIIQQMPLTVVQVVQYLIFNSMQLIFVLGNANNQTVVLLLHVWVLNVHHLCQ